MHIATMLLLAALPQQPDTTLLATVAARGREWATQHPVAGARTYPAAQQQYRAALALIDSSRWQDAAVRLQAVSRIDARNAAYRGDLGYVQARLGNWDDAAAAYESATQLQSGNPWYYVGLGLARAGQERWLEAGGMMALAANTDSAVISRPFIEAIVDYYQRANRTASQLEWYRLGTQRYPDVALWWLKLAQQTRESRGDTALGFRAIQRYVQMQPSEPLGLATYATYLFDRGQVDTAVAIARHIAADTTFRSFAATMFYNAGIRAMQAQNYNRASAMFNLALPGLADSSLVGRSRYYLGFADFNRAVTLMQAAETARNCDTVRLADSLTTNAETHLRAAVRVDSATIWPVVSSSIPQVKTNLGNMTRAYCPQPAQRRRND
jgi:tetratricopeptide (TPR) repeat protein